MYIGHGTATPHKVEDVWFDIILVMYECNVGLVILLPSPEAPHLIVAILGHYHQSLAWVTPHQHTQVLRGTYEYTTCYYGNSRLLRHICCYGNRIVTVVTMGVAIMLVGQHRFNTTFNICTCTYRVSYREGPWNCPLPPENLKICIVSYSYMTLWQCPSKIPVTLHNTWPIMTPEYTTD